MKKISMKKIGKLFPIIGVILFIYIIIEIGAEKIAHAFLSVPLQFYALSSIIFIPILILYIYQWQYICRKQKMDFSFFYIMKIYLLGLFYGTVTPGGIGWHIRIFYLRKKVKLQSKNVWQIL